MSDDPWNGRAETYRRSVVHREGWDLDLLVSWCDAGPGVAACDVAAGGGHVARRLRALGCEVTTCDAAAGMEPDVVTAAESLPFADGVFDLVTCRVAPHHFDDVPAAVAEMARVSRRLVVIEDLLFEDDLVEEAESLRDPTHRRAYAVDEWRSFLAGAGLHVERIAVGERPHETDAWLAATGCRGETATRVRELLAHRSRDGGRSWVNSVVVLRATESEPRPE